MTLAEPMPKNWCEDLPAATQAQKPGLATNDASHLERVLTVVIRLVGEVLRGHPQLLDEFNGGLRLIRQQYFP